MVGSTCSLVLEGRTTCLVTMQVPDHNVPFVRRLLRSLSMWGGTLIPIRRPAVSARVRGHAGGEGVLGLLSVRPHFC